MKLFVPGRICLFGEHTDWAGGYRRENPDLEKGYCLIVGTDQGIYADIETHPNTLVMTSAKEDGTRIGPVEIPMNSKDLLSHAAGGSFFSYAAGVAYEVMKRYHVSGLKIDNTHTDLPVKKGLSSSAAICVLVARAFNKMYNLSLSVSDEMELAYLGELRTGSQCGRMDQGCAYGNTPILMTVDGDKMDIVEVSVGCDFHFVLVDLCASKDTRKILYDLNQCYPVAETSIQNNVQTYLGPISTDITLQAVETLGYGRGETLGHLMTKAQIEFDQLVSPACPSELTAPVLHTLLQHPPLQPLILGGKGVGSQGDGTAQFLVKDPAARKQVIDIIQRDFNMPCLELTIPHRQKVRKAVIPAAGFGTRLFPVTKTMKKEFFPVIDGSGEIKPVIQVIVEEAVASGIESICLVVQESDIELFQSYFHESPDNAFYEKLSDAGKQQCDELKKLGRRVQFVCQKEQVGFGHAVHCAAEFVGQEPFLLMLGDHLFGSNSDVPCARQAIDVFHETGKSVVGLQKTPEHIVHHFGTVTGRWINDTEKTLEITEFSEKPDRDYARQKLGVEGLEVNTYLTLFGMYVLKPEIFDYLDRNIAANHLEAGEIQLTSCLDQLRGDDGFSGFIVDGERFDMGLPEAYRDTVWRWGRR